jgi:hypothetical protein
MVPKVKSSPWTRRRPEKSDATFAELVVSQKVGLPLKPSIAA